MCVRTYDGRLLDDNPVYSTAVLADVMMDWLVYCNVNSHTSQAGDQTDVFDRMTHLDVREGSDFSLIDAGRFMFQPISKSSLDDNLHRVHREFQHLCSGQR